ncbi:hypothetical protein VTK56DRAFT_675 [Thermocarpiscus australiensis]
MFELPDAKRVRREDLYDSASDRDSSPEREQDDDAELRAKLNARLSSLLSLDLDIIPDPTAAGPSPPEAEPEGNNPPDGPGEAEFEFRLFSTSDAPQKVILPPHEDEAVVAGGGGVAISQRPLSYYLRGELTPRERERFQFAAVSGRDVLAGARQRAWGLEVPWRVTKVTVVMGRKGVEGGFGDGVPVKQKRSEVGGEAVGEKKKKKRPGKKRRIVLRKREKARREAAAALEMQKISKEEHLREKKKRLNREKKLKRRRKEKEKKLAAKAGAEGAGSAVDSQSEAGSDGDE